MIFYGYFLWNIQLDVELFFNCDDFLQKLNLVIYPFTVLQSQTDF